MDATNCPVTSFGLSLSLSSFNQGSSKHLRAQKKEEEKNKRKWKHIFDGCLSLLALYLKNADSFCIIVLETVFVAFAHLPVLPVNLAVETAENKKKLQNAGTRR